MARKMTKVMDRFTDQLDRMVDVAGDRYVRLADVLKVILSTLFHGGTWKKAVTELVRLAPRLESVPTDHEDLVRKAADRDRYLDEMSRWRDRAADAEKDLGRVRSELELVREARADYHAKVVEARRERELLLNRGKPLDDIGHGVMVSDHTLHLIRRHLKWGKRIRATVFAMHGGNDLQDSKAAINGLIEAGTPYGTSDEPSDYQDLIRCEVCDNTVGDQDVWAFGLSSYDPVALEGVLAKYEGLGYVVETTRSGRRWVEHEGEFITTVQAPRSHNSHWGEVLFNTYSAGVVEEYLAG